jgi:capsule polysaccharide modification protein KpsS
VEIQQHLCFIIMFEFKVHQNTGMMVYCSVVASYKHHRCLEMRLFGPVYEQVREDRS